jgi:hypothetical protein
MTAHLGEAAKTGLRGLLRLQRRLDAVHPPGGQTRQHPLPLTSLGRSLVPRDELSNIVQ